MAWESKVGYVYYVDIKEPWNQGEIYYETEKHSVIHCENQNTKDKDLTKKVLKNGTKPK